ncbi:hypothetical protein CPC16_006861 [Podila verticillata]|nr:hypothetical protein CPC16_006861 [Podila verticillata]
MELSSIFRLDVTVAEYLLPFLNTCGPRFQFENVHCGHFRNRNLSRDRFGTALTLLKYDGSPYKGRSTGAEIAEAISFNEHWTSMVDDFTTNLTEQTKFVWLRLGSQTPDSEHHELSSRQEHSLEMTLDSGLGELTVLNDLEELDVTNINHRIGVKDLEWMRTSWPKLATLAGILRNCDLAQGPKSG